MLTFRSANNKDCGLILDFIKKLAEYEKMSDQVVATEALLEEWIFEQKKAEVLFPCLDWNQPSIDFYLSLGAVPMSDWTTYRLTGDVLQEMAR